MTANGAYDGEPPTQKPGRPPAVDIPLRAFCRAQHADLAQHTARDRHIQLMAEKGRMEWPRLTRYGRRALAETAMSRWKHLITPVNDTITLKDGHTSSYLGPARYPL